jgi:hypothetical protein
MKFLCCRFFGEVHKWVKFSSFGERLVFAAKINLLSNDYSRESEEPISKNSKKKKIWISSGTWNWKVECRFKWIFPLENTSSIVWKYLAEELETNERNLRFRCYYHICPTRKCNIILLFVDSNSKIVKLTLDINTAWFAWMPQLKKARLKLVPLSIFRFFSKVQFKTGRSFNCVNEALFKLQL